MNKYAVIVAGGTGTRMGGDLPKQFLPLNGKPVLYYTIKTFTDTFADLKTILVLPAVHLETGRKLINEYFNKKDIQLIAGGETRFQSVKNGLSLVVEEPGARQRIVGGGRARGDDQQAEGGNRDFANELAHRADGNTARCRLTDAPSMA